MRCEQVFTIPILLSIPLGLLGGYHNTKTFLSLLGPIGAKNASFLSQFYAKPICLPTQARDKQKKTLKKRCVSRRFLAGNRTCGGARGAGEGP